ncbi:MOB kinase activator 1B isoform X2 [Varroa destructor]|uniref:Uncharacterized protein n=1 Tax=Varroa destructor TaxID=109461 RepID=A0A7M7MDL1_VARDE|nr:MOB kinase activator 1B isoform X2 [Varroa destructor]
MSFIFGGRSSKTFKPKKHIPEGTHQYELMKQAAATLGSGNLRLAVMLPEGEDLNEWVAVNTVDFFNQINMLYGTITEFCREDTCPIMSAGPKYEYHWADGTTVKKPIKCSAPRYIDYLMTWVYAHIYHQHFAQVVQLGEEAHLNTSFKHFIFFVQEFSLIDRRELVPLQELIDQLTTRDQRTPLENGFESKKCRIQVLGRYYFADLQKCCIARHFCERSSCSLCNAKQIYKGKEKASVYDDKGNDNLVYDSELTYINVSFCEHGKFNRTRYGSSSYE